jgi:ribosomal protein S18 acetylase RimI-like enzyme
MDRGEVRVSELAHYGIKGMKWGVRKADPPASGKESKSQDIEVKLKNGTTMTLNSRPSPPMQKLVDRILHSPSKGHFERQSFHIKNQDGDRVGEMYMFSESRDSLHVGWIGVRDKYRGYGYATASMRAAVDNARAKGYKNLTLQAVNESKDAVHIYEKMGFKEDLTKEEPMEGLTNMKLKL